MRKIRHKTSVLATSGGLPKLVKNTLERKTSFNGNHPRNLNTLVEVVEIRCQILTPCPTLIVRESRMDAKPMRSRPDSRANAVITFNSREEDEILLHPPAEPIFGGRNITFRYLPSP
jgi:hypothetical protein